MNNKSFRKLFYNQWRSHWGGKGGRVPRQRKFVKNREKIGEKRGKIGKFLSLCPSWQIGLATLLSVIYKRFSTPLRNLPNRVIEAANHSSNSTWHLQKTLRLAVTFCKCNYCWVWRTNWLIYYGKNCHLTAHASHAQLEKMRKKKKVRIPYTRHSHKIWSVVVVDGL